MEKEKRASTGSGYLDLLRNTKTADVKVVVPKRRAVVEAQRSRCYVCHKALSEGICHFEEIDGPDPKTGANSRDLRAVCSSCFFDLTRKKKQQ